MVVGGGNGHHLSSYKQFHAAHAPYSATMNSRGSTHGMQAHGALKPSQQQPSGNVRHHQQGIPPNMYQHQGHATESDAVAHAPVIVRGQGQAPTFQHPVARTDSGSLHPQQHQNPSTQHPILVPDLEDDVLSTPSSIHKWPVMQGQGHANGWQEEASHHGIREERPVQSVNTNDNFKVVIRVRPPLPRELQGMNEPQSFQPIVKIDPSNQRITASDNPTALHSNDDPNSDHPGCISHVFTFDHVYDPQRNQQDVYDTTAKPAVMSTLEGYNATIMAYGQTGTGKTYTMEGFTNDSQRGIVPRSMEEIFKYIQHCGNPHTKFLVRASYLQIYNEVISDLLKPERTNLNIREDKKKGVFVEGLSEWVVRSPAEIYGLMERGGAVRATGSTKMNELSSRSHAVFIIIVEQSFTTFYDGQGRAVSANNDATRSSRQTFRVGKLNLVDLAGSERVRLTGATGIRLEESKKINQSLSALGNVIAALTDPKGRQHIPYRDSKLTRILEDSLGGNCKTTMMAMISPAQESFVESLSTLKFANRAKNIKNEATVNEDLDQKALLRKYERELKRLRAELEEKTKNVVDKRKLLEVEEQRKRAERDKLAALTELENRSREFMNEKAQKRKLEERIATMQSQLLVGGNKLEDTPAFRTALQQEQSKIHKEYEVKMADLERERQNIEEDKAQVDRYKQLLLKQRDIMIALTARLNERDETIVSLQEELEAYDRNKGMLEDALDQKTAELIHAQRVAVETANGQQAGDDVAHKSLSHKHDLPAGLESQLEANINEAVREVLQVEEAEHEREVQRWRSLLLVEEENRRQLESVIEIAKAQASPSAPDLHSQINSAIRAEAERIQAPFRLQVESLEKEKTHLQEANEKIQNELYSARQELHKAMEALDREAMNKLSDCKDSAVLEEFGQANLERLWEKVHNLDQENRKLKLKLRLTHKMHSRSRGSQGENDQVTGDSSCGDHVDAVANQRIVDLEDRVQTLKLQHEQFRKDVGARLEEKTNLLLRSEEENSRLQSLLSTSHTASGKEPSDEVVQLRQQVVSHTKERAALKTILESKIKSLVDGICSAFLPETGPPTANGLNQQRAMRELSALQKLVNASVVALNQDHSSQRGPIVAKPTGVTSSMGVSSTPNHPNAPVPVGSVVATAPGPGGGAPLNQHHHRNNNNNISSSNSNNNNGGAPLPTSHDGMLVRRKQ